MLQLVCYLIPFWRQKEPHIHIFNNSLRFCQPLKRFFKATLSFISILNRTIMLNRAGCHHLLTGMGLLFFISCTPKYTSQPGTAKATVDSVKTKAMSEFDLQSAGTEKTVDMTQFTRKVLNIAYTKTKNPRQTLDIIYPTTGEAPYKLIVVFHGGGWAKGDKQSESIGSIFQAVTQGYAVASVNYRLSDEVTWPKPLHDAKAAIRYLRANAFRHLLDAEKVVVWGTSTGGHLAQMLAATNNQRAFEDLRMGYATISSAVQGVVSWYGISDITALPATATPAANKLMGFDVKAEKSRAREASPVELVTADFPPIWLVHGTGDELVPFEQSTNMKKKVDEATGRIISTVKPYNGAAHGDPAIKTPVSVGDDLDFVDKILFNGRNPYRNRNYITIKMSE
jgi:acetyl esterase/lipase